MDYHKPILLNEILEHLQVQKDRTYIDATLGDGGHSIEMLKKGSKVLGIDVNEGSINRALYRIQNLGLSGNFVSATGNFSKIDEIARAHGFDQVHGILFDLGYSSSQLDEDDLGLSFQKDQFLDMRLDKTLGVNASDFINALSEKELAKLIFDLSDEKYAKRFAKAIVEARNKKKIQTTAQLVEVLVSEAPSNYENGRIHPATRTFQALRIAVNNELENLRDALPRAARTLLPGGRMSVLSFQSLEDRLTKEFGQSAQPNIKPVNDKPVVPSNEEIVNNPRSRSAKLRTYEKIY